MLRCVNLSPALSIQQPPFPCYNFTRHSKPYVATVHERELRTLLMNASTFNLDMLSPYLFGLGIAGTTALLVGTGLILWHFRGSRIQSFNWRLRSWRLKQLSAVACLFFLAMAASYWVIQELLGWVYLILAVQTGSWWLRI